MLFLQQNIKFQLTRPRGTRHNEWFRDENLQGFNSRVRGGRDALYSMVVSCLCSFNSRVRGGRDKDVVGITKTLVCFNSRVRGGRDFTLITSHYHYNVSTHASAGDATRLKSSG